MNPEKESYPDEEDMEDMVLDEERENNLKRIIDDVKEVWEGDDKALLLA